MSQKAEGPPRTFSSLDERGDTLIELLIALVIIALVVGPFLGLTFEMLSGSAEHRGIASLNNLMKGFAETAKSEIELTPASGGPSFNNCSGTVSYKLLSLPTPQVAAPGAAVTIFATGFDSGLPLSAFAVTVGGVTATKTTKRSQASSGSEMGNMQLTFFVPASPSGSQPIKVSDGIAGQTVTSSSATNLTVTAAGTTSHVSTLARYTMGVKLIRYWNPGKSTETSPLTDCELNGGVQLLTLHGRAGNGVSDTLTFDVRNPSPSHTTLATPSVSVSATPVFATKPSTGTSGLVFAAIVTPAAGNKRPSKTLTWSITEAGTRVGCPTHSPPVNGTDNASNYTCTITLTTSSATGRYAATATYPAVAATATTPGSAAESWVSIATVYGPNGGGAVTLSPKTTPPNTAGKTFTFTYTVGTGGMNGGELLIKVPSPSTPSTAWTKPQSTNTVAVGYTTAKVGTTTVSLTTTGYMIEITSLTLTVGTKLTVVYGQGGGASGVTSPTKTGPYAFIVQQNSVPSGSLASVSGSPLTVTVT